MQPKRPDITSMSSSLTSNSKHHGYCCQPQSEASGRRASAELVACVTALIVMIDCPQANAPQRWSKAMSLTHHGAIVVVRCYCWVNCRSLQALSRARIHLHAIPATLIIVVVTDARCAEVRWRESRDNPGRARFMTRTVVIAIIDEAQGDEEHPGLCR